MVQHTHSTNRISRRSAASAKSLAAALDLVTDGVLLLGPEFEIRAANAKAAELLGRPLPCGACLVEMLLPASAARLRASAHVLQQEVLHQGTTTKITLQIETAERVTADLEVTLHVAPEDESTTIAIVQSARGAEASQRLSLDDRDFLTGLPTRAVLAARLKEVESHARQHGSQYAILFVDLDAFKQLNDQLGHAAGDCVLSVVAQRLQAAVRPSDLVVRYGGDEFVIVVDDITAPQLARLARRLRTTLGAPLEIAGQWIVTTASMGRAFGDATRSAPQVLDEADRAMYRAKSARLKKRPR